MVMRCKFSHVQSVVRVESLGTGLEATQRWQR